MASTKRKSALPSRATEVSHEWLWTCRDFQERYPSLYELLAAGIFEGVPRKGATVTLFAGDLRLKASVCDRETHQVLWIDLTGTGDVLGEIEEAISSDQVRWKPSKNGDGKVPF